MAYFLGIDEAGYGPNLGPLVVSASVWHVAGRKTAANLYDLLADAVTPTMAPRSRTNAHAETSERVTIADSKVVYRAGQGLGDLEANLFAVLGLCGSIPDTWEMLWQQLAASSLAERDAAPWHDGFDVSLPLVADVDFIARRAEILRHAARKARVTLVAVGSRAVFPARFNCLAEQDNSKGTALSILSIELLAEMLAALPASDEPCFVLCDKHGGRNRYSPLLQRQFPDVLIGVHGESRDVSTYRFQLAARAVEVKFKSEGEQFLPTALASMASKYLRELSMRAFNDFWCARVPNLRPTAGYPGDAARFKREIELEQAALGIDDAVLWRTR
ncbi:MAG: hypothetical protein KF708_15380 [Pirellulales bacterium]|nr:hypothetical protein [Pirellulales bacterium]